MTKMSPRQVGARVQRFEDVRLMSGAAKYIADITLPNMLHLSFVRSQVAHAKILDIDISMLEDLDYPVQIFTGKDTAHLALRANQDVPEMQRSAQPLLALDRLRFVGDPVAAVLADDPYLAEDAAELVFVDFDPLPVVANMAQARAADTTPLFEGWTGNTFVERQMKGGDLDAARAQAAHVIRRTYRNQRQTGVPMECRGVVAEYDQGTRVLTLWSSTQMPHLVRTYICEELGLPESRIRVIAPEVGGGFGIKGQVFADEVLIAWLAIQTGRPVKWIEDRRENLIASIHARDHEHILEAYVSAEGRLLGLKADISVDVGAYSTYPFTAAGDPGMAAKVMPGPYDFQAYEATFRALATNKCPLGTYRGVARPSAVFSQERLMDTIAQEIGMDPFEFRLRNVIRDFPYKNVLGFTYDPGSYAESLEKMRDLLAEDIKLAEASKAAPDHRIGVGIACFIEQTAHGTGDFTKRRSPIETGYVSARVEMTTDGEVLIGLGLQSHGQGHETVMAQVASDALGVAPERVFVRHGDTLTSPYSVGTWGSRGGPLGGGAVHIAATKIADKLRRIAAHLLQAESADAIQLDQGRAALISDPGRFIPIPELARAALRNVDRLPEGMVPGLTEEFSLDGPKDGSYANAVHAAVVDIDLKTGKMAIRRFVVVEDCGTILNPMIVDGQVRGGVIQGIGSAMLEHIIYDDEGQPLTTTFADYLMPLAPEMPEVDIHHLETPTPLTPLGAKGLGEGGAIGPAAAIANAVTNALSVEVTQTPLNAQQIWKLINETKT